MRSTLVIFLVCCGFLGASLGSLLSLVAARGYSLRRTVWPPSRCDACGDGIPIYLNIPVFGWLFLGGRSACCGAAIPLRFFLVELALALAGVLLGWWLVISHVR